MENKVFSSPFLYLFFFFFMCLNTDTYSLIIFPFFELSNASSFNLSPQVTFSRQLIILRFSPLDFLTFSFKVFLRICLFPSPPPHPHYTQGRLSKLDGLAWRREGWRELSAFFNDLPLYREERTKFFYSAQWTNVRQLLQVATVEYYWIPGVRTVKS